MKRVQVYISGKVQGVFFRAETQRTAIGFRIIGWVKNMANGRVEGLFEGDDANANNMLAWCHIGPPAARVEEVLTLVIYCFLAASFCASAQAVPGFLSNNFNTSVV